MNDVSISHDSLTAAPPPTLPPARRSCAPSRSSTSAHAIDHFALLIFPAVVLTLEIVYRRPYAELIALSTAAFVAFGVFSIPAGWPRDRWSRRNMMVVFYFGCAASLAAAGVAPTPLDARGGDVRARHVRRDLSPGRHGDADRRVEGAPARTLAFNGVCGNLGVTLAAGISTTLAASIGLARRVSWLPAAVCLATGMAYMALVPDDRTASASAAPRRACRCRTAPCW